LRDSSRPSRHCSCTGGPSVPTSAGPSCFTFFKPRLHFADNGSHRTVTVPPPRGQICYAVVARVGSSRGGRRALLPVRIGTFPSRKSLQFCANGSMPFLWRGLSSPGRSPAQTQGSFRRCPNHPVSSTRTPRAAPRSRLSPMTPSRASARPRAAVRRRPPPLHQLRRLRPRPPHLPLNPLQFPLQLTLKAADKGVVIVGVRA
jgi:hypothetical protein